MGGESGPGDRDQGSDQGSQTGPPSGVSRPTLQDLVDHGQTPLFHAEHAGRYERQRLIAAYEAEFDCRLVVVRDEIWGESVTLFEELICDADVERDLHLILDSPGGDGEAALRLARAAQSRCREFTVIVPDQAKSAATILALGAHTIVMGPTSDLGPVDAQLQIPKGDDGDWDLVSAKDLIAAVDAAEAAIERAPDTYPLYVSLLADVTGIMVQQARSALERTEDLVDEALRSQPDRTAAESQQLLAALKTRLIERPKHHGAVFGATDAAATGLPIVLLDPSSLQWRAIWRLWAKYFVLRARVYEGIRASRITPFVES